MKSSSGINIIQRISINGAEPVDLFSFSPEELERMRETWGERVGRVVSEHIAHNEADRIAVLNEPEFCVFAL